MKIVLKNSRDILIKKGDFMETYRLGLYIKKNSTQNCNYFNY